MLKIKTKWLLLIISKWTSNNKETKRRMFLLFFMFLTFFSQIQSLVTITNLNINGVVYFKTESSPYIVEQDLTINKKSKLVIEPGVEVRFNKGKKIIVQGVLEAIVSNFLFVKKKKDYYKVLIDWLIEGSGKI